MLQRLLRRSGLQILHGFALAGKVGAEVAERCVCVRPSAYGHLAATKEPTWLDNWQSHE